ncbi:glycine cleavage T C-terminal barrel domain-containing protein [Spongisporangium articulatum]|uniref:Glycine cleavage T C-terminal barrel domain-containing protein n=1 Tax=Spongisporangium articulatum TaxID=3362603 RepID=A0ABW8APU6_9ACTN
MSVATGNPEILTSPLADRHPATAVVERIGAADVVRHYGDAASEYLGLRSHGARIDLSGAGLVEVTGPDAFDLVQGALTRDLEFVTPEQSLVGALLDDDGHPVDIVTAYNVGDGFRLETSLGTGPAVIEHLKGLAERVGLDVGFRLGNPETTIILVEGPKVATLLGGAIHRDIPAMPLMGVRKAELGGVPVTLVRSGFTGEYGYKFFVATEHAAAVWDALQDLTPAGSQALETAMLEVRQPIAHKELPAAGNALQLGWSWLVDVTKDDYVGRAALMDAFEGGARAETVGFTTEGTEPVAAGSDVRLGDEAVGLVLHSVYSPGLGKVLGLARIEPELVAPGQEFGLDGDRAGLTLVAPYLTPASWARS